MRQTLRHCALGIVVALALAACAPTSQTSTPKAALASKEDLWRMSGTKDAIAALDQSLSDACGVSIAVPDDLLKLPQTDAVCVRTHLVSAFEAAEGSDYCALNRNLKQFVSCILEGQFIGRVIDNSGLPRLAPEIQWGDPDEAGRQANKLLTEKIKATCLSPSDAARKECAETEMLRYFGIDASAIDFCPNREQRDACIYWAAFARSIRIKLDRIS
jgi:hypothetical protein